MCYTCINLLTSEDLFPEVFLYFTESSDEENDEDNNEEDEGNNEEEEEEEEEEEDEDKKSDKSQRRSYYLREHKPRTQLFEVPIGNQYGTRIQSLIIIGFNWCDLSLLISTVDDNKMWW